MERGGSPLAVYISVSTDAFAETFDKAKASSNRSQYANIRRPLRGIQAKPNTYAVMRVMTSGGRPIPLIDSGSSEFDDNKIGRSETYANYIIQNIREQRAEKQQIIETFGEDYVYFFGERPRFLDVTGMLINTADFNWKSEFWANYENHLRGTKLVEQNARLYFYFDDVVVEGYLMGASMVGDANQPHMMPLQFQLFVTNYAILSSVGNVIFPYSSKYSEAGDHLTVVPPSMTATKLAGDLKAGEGGLNAFLAKAAKFATDASFSIQSTIETIRDTFYGRQLVVPEGLSAMGDSLKFSPPIENRGKYQAAPIQRPFYEMSDEYVERDPEALSGATKAAFYREKLRLEGELKVRSPEELDANARREFKRAGISCDKPNAMMAILGRGAFAAVQYTAPFALAKVGGGKIGQADQVTQMLGKVF